MCQHKHQPSNILGFAILLCFWAAMTASAPGYTCYQSGIGEVLVSKGRVYFQQADDSLTALDLQTGAVIIRTSPRRIGGRLRESDYGIAALSYVGIALLDRATLDVIWQAQTYSEPHVQKGMVVSYDRNGLVTCLRLKDGSEAWRYPHPGTAELDVVDGRVLVFSDDHVVVLDLETGRQLCALKPASEDEQFRKGFIHGDRVYIAVGLRDDKGYEVERIVTFDGIGTQLSATTVPAADREFSYTHPFVMDGLAFSSAGVRLVTEPVVRERDGQRTYVLGARKATITRSGGRPAVVTMNVDGKALWRGFLPYLESTGYVHAVMDGDRLLLASDFGHLECVDAVTGRSLWLYSSPTLVVVGSWTSPNGLPPRETTRQRVFRAQNAGRENLPGLSLLPSAVAMDDFDSATILADPSRSVRPRLIFDPKPIDPYKSLAEDTRLAWSGVAVALIAMGALVLLMRRWAWRNAYLAGASAIAVVYLSVWLEATCRISDFATWTTKAVIVAMLGMFVCYAARSLPNKGFWSKFITAAGIVLACGWLVHVLPLLRYG